MSESTLAMLLRMGRTTELLSTACEVLEEAPQLKMQPDLGKQLHDLLQHSLGNDCTPMD